MDRPTYIKYLEANAAVNILFEYSNEFGKRKLSIMEFNDKVNLFMLIPQFHFFKDWVIKHYNNKFHINFLFDVTGGLIKIS
jgi:hypothetical protein